MANGKDDIRVALAWPRHFKRRALQRELGPAGPLALIDLWCFAGEHRPDGVFKSAEEIEIAVDWPKSKRGKLHAALVSTGWIEGDGVTLHDWQEEQPWIAGRSGRVAAAQANGKRGGERKAARGKESPPGTGSGMGSEPLAEGYRNPSEPLPLRSAPPLPPHHSAPATADLASPSQPQSRAGPDRKPAWRPDDTGPRPPDSGGERMRALARERSALAADLRAKVAAAVPLTPTEGRLLAEAEAWLARVGARPPTNGAVPHA